jgi:hypothetical protein
VPQIGNAPKIDFGRFKTPDRWRSLLEVIAIAGRAVDIILSINTQNLFTSAKWLEILPIAIPSL